MKLTIKKALSFLLGLVLIVVIAFFIYANNYYKADTEVKELINNESIVVKDNLVELIPTSENKNTGIIFYPGAKVEYTSYIPLLNKLKEQGYTIISVKMPFNMAIFGKDKADSVLKSYPNIKHWYIAGHSMGGAMASSYAANNQDKINGLILLGAYPYGNYPLSKTLTIYGSLNTSVKEKINYKEDVVEIEGGNHAQFGNYGKQKGDADALISADKQQIESVSAIIEFIEKNN